MNEHSIASKDGTKLFYRQWPVVGAEDIVLIVPGYADHAGRYPHVAEAIIEQGITVFALDLRGHGKSDGARGHISRFSQYHDDLLVMVEHIRSASKGRNLFLLGHSMGGLVVLSTLLNNKIAVEGVILTSPFLGMSMQVPPAKALLGRLLSSIYPTLALPNEIAPECLSRDATVGNTYREDPFVFKTATARWFTETMGAMDDVFVKAPEFRWPCLLLQAGDDRIVDVAASRRLFEALGTGEKTYIEYEGFCHEILNEIGKEKCLRDITCWLKREKQA